MAIFPEEISMRYPFIIEPQWDTLTKEKDSGNEQRRQKSLYPRFNVRGLLSGIDSADMQTIWDFYMARKGAFESFYFFDPVPDLGIVTSYQNLLIGTGDGSTGIWDLPGKSTSSQIIYIDGVTQTITTDYTILTSGGDGNADRVSFVSDPALGESLSCNFTGRLRVKCRFEKDKLPRELFSYLAFNFGIELKGLAGN